MYHRLPCNTYRLTVIGCIPEAILFLNHCRHCTSTNLLEDMRQRDQCIPLIEATACGNLAAQYIDHGYSPLDSGTSHWKHPKELKTGRDLVHQHASVALALQNQSVPVSLTPSFNARASRTASGNKLQHRGQHILRAGNAIQRAFVMHSRTAVLTPGLPMSVS